MAGRTGALHGHFVDALLANLDTDDAEFLTRIAIVDDLHAELCREMTGMPDAAERLARLARDTPLLVAGEGSDWLRMSREFGREVANGKEARKICKIGVFYETVEETLAANGFAPNPKGRQQGYLRKAA